MHSSKGLDFPVVLVFVPHLPGNDSLSDRTRDTLQRNLIYVSLTRAMDNLNVFIRNNPSEQPLKDLIRAFDEQEGK
jgi:superfamily I DNA/RNA helicase